MPHTSSHMLLEQSPGLFCCVFLLGGGNLREGCTTNCAQELLLESYFQLSPWGLLQAVLRKSCSAGMEPQSLASKPTVSLLIYLSGLLEAISYIVIVSYNFHCCLFPYRDAYDCASETREVRTHSPWSIFHLKIFIYHM